MSPGTQSTTGQKHLREGLWGPWGFSGEDGNVDEVAKQGGPAAGGRVGASQDLLAPGGNGGASSPTSLHGGWQCVIVKGKVSLLPRSNETQESSLELLTTVLRNYDYIGTEHGIIIHYADGAFLLKSCKPSLKSCK